MELSDVEDVADTVLSTDEEEQDDDADDGGFLRRANTSRRSSPGPASPARSTPFARRRYVRRNDDNDDDEEEHDDEDVDMGGGHEAGRHLHSAVRHLDMSGGAASVGSGMLLFSPATPDLSRETMGSASAGSAGGLGLGFGHSFAFGAPLHGVAASAAAAAAAPSSSSASSLRSHGARTPERAPSSASPFSAAFTSGTVPKSPHHFVSPSSVGSLTPIDRPMPDQHAFSPSVPQRHTPKRNETPCPPTPARTPGWVIKRRLERQSSLSDTKILFGDVDEHELSFERSFESLGQMGVGSFSVVYKARSKHDGQVYAIKRMKKQFRSRRDRDAHLTEIQAYQAIRNPGPHIVKYVAAWQEEGYLYLQMELCEFGNVENTLHDKDTSDMWGTDAAVLTLIHDIATALAAMHASGVAHMDVKPENIFIDSRGMIKLGDLGMAVIQGGNKPDEEGDNRYMAKELLNGKHEYMPADIFSLGITAWQLASCTAELPTEGPYWQSLRRLQFPAAERVVSADLMQLICRMMDPEPAARPSAQEIVTFVKQRIDPALVRSTFTRSVRRTLEFTALELGRSPSMIGMDLSKLGSPTAQSTDSSAEHSADPRRPAPLTISAEAAPASRNDLMTPINQPITHSFWRM